MILTLCYQNDIICVNKYIMYRGEKDARGLIILIHTHMSIIYTICGVDYILKIVTKVHV